MGTSCQFLNNAKMRTHLSRTKIGLDARSAKVNEKCEVLKRNVIDITSMDIIYCMSNNSSLYMLLSLYRKL